MSDDAKKRPSKIEKAKKQLDSKYSVIKEQPRSHLHAHKQNVPEEWHVDDTPAPSKKPKTQSDHPIFKKVFLISVVFFVVAAIIAAFSLFGGRNVVSTDAIDLEIVTRAFVDGGETFDVTVEIANRNTSDLELADLIFEYPRGSSEEGDTMRLRRSLNSIRSGQTVLEDFTATLFGEEGDERIIRATLEYRVAGSNAIFVKETDIAVEVRSTPIQLTLDAPSTTVNNQSITLDARVLSNATNVTNNVLLRVEYPAGFKFQEANPQPALDNNVWLLGDLEPGGEREISITGNMRGQTGEERVFRAFIGEQDPENEKELVAAFNSVIHAVGIDVSFLGASIFVNGEAEDTSVNNGTEIPITVQWRNTLPVQLSDVEITLAFSGNAYDPTRIRPSTGFFDSNTDEISWNRSTTAELARVEPGQSGNLQFSLTPKPLVSGGSVLDKPEIFLDVSVSGIDPEGSIKQASQIDQRTIAVNSDFQITPQTLYYSGPLQNSGPYPPEPGQRTVMTLGWSVSTSANNIENAIVTTRLPNNVEWVGAVTPGSEDVSYNSIKREIKWKLGNVERGTGFSLPPRNVFFQVAVTPSTSQIGSAPVLTEDIILSGDDAFTGVFLRNIKRAHTTRLVNDSVSAPGRIE